MPTRGAFIRLQPFRKLNPTDLLDTAFASKTSLARLNKSIQEGIVIHDLSDFTENEFLSVVLLFLRIGRGAVVDDDDTVALIIRRTRR